MKTYKLIILLISFIYVYSDNEIKKYENNNPNSIDDCNSQNSEEELENKIIAVILNIKF